MKTPKPSITAGMNVPLFKKEGRPSPFSVSDLNVLAGLAKALANPKIVRGEHDAVHLSDSNIVFEIRNETAGVAAPFQTSLHHATYDSAEDAIYGVRGGYVFKFNSFSGQATSAYSRFAAPCMGDTCIAYNSVTGMLYASSWSDPGGGDNLAYPTAQLIYEINPLTLAVTATWNLKTLSPFSNLTGPYCGPHEIVCESGLIYGWFHDLGTTATQGHMFSLNPGSSAFVVGSTYFSIGPINSLAFNGGKIWATASDDNTFFTANTVTLVNDPEVALGAAAFGICADPVSGNTYYTTRTATIKVVNASSVVLADIALTSPTPRPIRIRYNPNTLMIYVPSSLDNTVTVIDPLTNTIAAVKTGFDSPFDMVFTPSKVFAVQHGLSGLKEVV